MKKKGYTLAEALIAMGIIGVIAAIMLPMMNKYKPDANKALFIRTYDSIAETVSVLASNDKLYPHEITIQNEPEGCEETNRCNYWDISKAPLVNYQKIKLPDGTEIGGGNGLNDMTKKFCDSMSYYLHTSSYTCNNSSTNISLLNNVEINFKRTDNNPYFNTEITLPNDENKYKLIIFVNGHIIPDFKDNDTAIGYLVTRGNWKNSSSDNIKNAVNKEKEKNNKNFNYWNDFLKKETTITKHQFNGEQIEGAGNLFSSD